MRHFVMGMSMRMGGQRLSAALSMVKPGILYRDLGTVIEKEVKVFGSTNLLWAWYWAIVPIPNVPHDHNNAKGAMKVVYVFIVEPMINLGSINDMTSITPNGNAILTAHENKPVMTWNPDVTLH